MPCALRELPNAVAIDETGKIRLSGPISIGSTASEIFLLEYAEGFPERQVAWGRHPRRGNSAVVAAACGPVQFDGACALSCGTTGLGPRGEDIINAATRRGYKRDEGSRVHARAGTIPISPISGACLGCIGRCPLILRMRHRRPARCILTCCATERPMLMQSVSDMSSDARPDAAHRAARSRAPPETAVVKIDGCKASEDGECPWMNSQTLQTEPSIAPASIHGIEMASRRRRCHSHPGAIERGRADFGENGTKLPIAAHEYTP